MMQSPERNWDRIYSSHPDHLAAGEAAIAAVYPDARNPFAHLDLAAEGLDAWTVSEVWVMAGGGGPANRYVDVTETFHRKLAALRAHVSQTAHMDDLETMLRTWLSANASAAGLPDGRLAEAFRIVDTR
jgi:LmbE family N-acetylglucosaminyl deacetylase